MSKKELTKLQLSLEEAQLQKEAVERHLRLEIDSLKSRLQQQQSGGWEGGAGGVAALLEDLRGEHDRAMGRLREENHDLRKRAGQLEVEVSRLQDEGILAAAKHKEEVAYLQVPGPGPSPTRAPSPTELSRCSAYLRVAWAVHRTLSTSLADPVSRIPFIAPPRAFAWPQERRGAEAADADRRRDEELRTIERRHADAVAALKKIHLDELQVRLIHHY
jgi:hypothetical protein